MRFAGCLFLCAATCGAVAPNTLTDQERAAAWRLLFDGKSFAGWTNPADLSPAGDSWAIRDGALVARKEPRILDDLVTAESFRDFELTFEFRLEPGGNSGVKYRSWASAFLIQQGPGWESGRVGERASLRPDQRGNTYIVAYEFQLIDDDRHPDAKNGPDRRTGALYALRAPDTPADEKAGEWHSGRLLVDGSRVEHWVDGARLLAADLRDPSLMAKIKERWGRIDDVWQKFLQHAGKQSPIALQNHGDSVVEFRSIKIRTR